MPLHTDSIFTSITNAAVFGNSFCKYYNMLFSYFNVFFAFLMVFFGYNIDNFSNVQYNKYIIMLGRDIR